MAASCMVDVGFMKKSIASRFASLLAVFGDDLLDAPQIGRRREIPLESLRTRAHFLESTELGERFDGDSLALLRQRA